MSSLMVASHVGLWLVVLCLLLAVFALARQIGLLHQRILPAGARMTADGPAIAAAAPPVEATDVLGRAVTLGTARGKATLLVFVSPGCSACTELLPGLYALWRSERKLLDVILLSTATDEVRNREFFDRHTVKDIPFVISRSLAESYQITTPPYSVFVGADGLVKAKGLINHLEHLESLVTAARLGYPTIESFVHGGGRPAASEAPHVAA